MNSVIIKAKRGFLANTTETQHIAFKTTFNGETLYEVYYAGSRVFLPEEDVVEVSPVETYWFVKTVSKATAKNTNFAGEVHTYIFGKEDFRLFEDVPGGFFNKDLTNAPYCIVEHGYKRPCDAKRSYSFKHPQNDEAWRTTVKLVSLDVQKDENGVYHVV